MGIDERDVRRAAKEAAARESERETSALRRALNDGGYRKDYGPKGCAGIVYGFAVVATVLVVLVKGGKR